MTDKKKIEHIDTTKWVKNRHGINIFFSDMDFVLADKLNEVIELMTYEN